MTQIIGVYYQAPDYTSSPHLPTIAFTDEGDADAWISRQNGWGGVGINTDFHKHIIELDPPASPPPSRCTCATKAGEGPNDKHYLSCQIWQDLAAAAHRAL